MTQAKGPGLSSAKPFPGLRSFDYGDSDWFFGREDQIYALYRLLDGSRFIAVVGSSGSGKSSLVRAGLRPLLDEESRGEGGRQWRWVEVRPGNSPLDNLADSLARLSQDAEGLGAGIAAARRGRILGALKESSLGLIESLKLLDGIEGQTLVLMVDQFEELFRYGVTGSDPSQRRVANARWREDATHFVQLLQEATRDREKRIHVLITLRSDFIGECAQFHGLPELVSATQYLVPSLTRDQRQEVICEPVEKAGGSIEPALLQSLLNEGTDEVDQLPVLQHCLMRLWKQALEDASQQTSAGVELTNDLYERVGRVEGALSRHADEVMDSLPGQALDIELVFRAMAETDAEGRAIRRPVSFEQLAAETGIAEEPLRRVIDRFRAEDCSFLASPAATPVVGPQTIVDVGHEALLRRWEKISARRSEAIETGDADRGWLVAEEDDARVYRGLLALSEIGTHSRLENVEERWDWWRRPGHTPAWTDRYGGGFDRVQALLEYNVAETEADKLRAVRAVRRARNLRISVAVAAAIALIGLSLWSRASLQAKARAEDERDRLYTQIQSMEFQLSDQLRLVPEGRGAVISILGENCDPSRERTGRAARTNEGAARYDDVPWLRERGTRQILHGLQCIMLSHTQGALKSYDDIIDQLERSPNACSLELLRAQALIYRGQAKVTAEDRRGALEDDRKARALALDVPVRVYAATRSWFPDETQRDCLRVLEDRPAQIFQLESQALAGAASVETQDHRFVQAQADLARLQSEIEDAGRQGRAQEAARNLISDLQSEIEDAGRRGRAQEAARNLIRDLQERRGAPLTRSAFWTSADAQRLQRLGELYKEAGTPGQALAALGQAMNAYQQIVASDEDHTYTKFSSYEVQFEYAGSEWADAVLSQSPSAAQAGRAQQRIQSALEYFSGLKSKDLTNSYWWTVLGRIHLAAAERESESKDTHAASGDFAEAIKDFRRVSVLDPADLLSLKDLAQAEGARGRMEQRLGQDAAAQEDFQQAAHDSGRASVRSSHLGH